MTVIRSAISRSIPEIFLESSCNMEKWNAFSNTTILFRKVLWWKMVKCFLKYNLLTMKSRYSLRSYMSRAFRKNDKRLMNIPESSIYIRSCVITITGYWVIVCVLSLWMWCSLIERIVDSLQLKFFLFLRFWKVHERSMICHQFIILLSKFTIINDNQCKYRKTRHVIRKWTIFECIRIRFGDHINHGSSLFIYVSWSSEHDD